MSKVQRLIIAVGMLLLAVNLVVVPYNSYNKTNLGYSMVYKPVRFGSHDSKPEKETSSGDLRDGFIDIQQLLIQSTAIMFLTLGVFFIVGVIRND
jgi:hypothetical protein